MTPLDSSRIDPTYRLLALCARAEGHSVFYKQLAQQIEQFTTWDTLPAQAEIHGMGPLLWHHLRQANINFPSETERTLRGLYLRERALNQAHALTLVEVQTLWEQVGIQPLVLKGLALAYKYYPDPALRPVSDIDLLLKKEDILPALRVLADVGYRVKFPDPNLRVLPNELTADSPSRNGVSTHLELRHYDPAHRQINDVLRDDELADFNQPPQKIMVEGCPVYAPSMMDTLHYLMRHMVRHLFLAHEGKPLPLKWTADITGLVEYHADEIDWEEIQRKDPAFLHRLSVLYSLSPLPDKYEEIIPIKKIEPPAGVNHYPNGWPQRVVSDWKKIGLWRFTRRTFQSPSAWWLRLFYGIDKRGVFWYGQVIYRLRLLRLMLWGILRRNVFNEGKTPPGK